MQVIIHGLLTGKQKAQVFKNGEALTTGELLAELVEYGYIDESKPRKHNLFTVRRACTSLLNRGLLAGHYVIDCDHPEAKTLSWSAVKAETQ